MPFITEELWAASGRGEKRVLALSRWPRADFTDLAADAEINWLVELIGAVRSVRSEMNVPPSARRSSSRSATRPGWQSASRGTSRRSSVSRASTASGRAERRAARVGAGRGRRRDLRAAACRHRRLLRRGSAAREGDREDRGRDRPHRQEARQRQVRLRARRKRWWRRSVRSARPMPPMASASPRRWSASRKRRKLLEKLAASCLHSRVTARTRVCRSVDRSRRRSGGGWLEDRSSTSHGFGYRATAVLSHSRTLQQLLQKHALGDAPFAPRSVLMFFNDWASGVDASRRRAAGAGGAPDRRKTAPSGERG